MKRSRFTAILVVSLLLLFTVVAAIHLSSRTKGSVGNIQITYNDSIIEIPLEELPLSSVQGTVTNGKGESCSIDAQGIILSDILKTAGIGDYQSVTIVADDEYRAEVSAEEVAMANKVYLLRTETTFPQVIVFGDKNSKRNVTNVVMLVVE